MVYPDENTLGGCKVLNPTRSNRALQRTGVDLPSLIVYTPRDPKRKKAVKKTRRDETPISISVTKHISLHFLLQ